MVRFIGIDPSTKTGFVALGKSGEVLRAKELTGVGSEDPRRMVTLIQEVMLHIQPGDIICIEGFPYDTQRAMFAGGLHHGIRNELFKRKMPYRDVAPNAVKKFVNVTGWEGEVGNKRRLKGPEKKRAVMAAVREHFNFEHKSDNVVDAYILAVIAREIWLSSTMLRPLPKHQEEVIHKVMNPEDKKVKK